MNLKTIESSVKQALIDNVDARKSDFKLYVETLKRLGYKTKRLEKFFNKYSYNLPSFAAVTRSRRLVQATFPDLKDKHISKFRKKIKVPEFRDYSKTKVN